MVWDIVIKQYNIESETECLMNNAWLDRYKL